MGTASVNGGTHGGAVQGKLTMGAILFIKVSVNLINLDMGIVR